MTGSESNTGKGLSLADRLSLPRIHWAWVLLLVGLGALAWASRPVIGPFVAAFVLAYLLDPMTSRLQTLPLGRLRLPRAIAAALMLLVFFAALIGLILITAPIVEAQVSQLAARLPDLAQRTLPLVQDLADRLTGRFDVSSFVDTLGQRAIGWGSENIGPLIASGLSVFNAVNYLIVTPIVAYYLLRDWPGIIATVQSWWPRPALSGLKQVAADSDAALGGFIRGQSLVCLVLAVFYAAGWSLVGLNYAVVLGLLAGIFGFVPFLGVIVAVALSLMVALGQFGLDWWQLFLVYGVFQIGQILESAFLTPNLIGDRIGLHPVWVLFSVFAGGAVAGVVGVFVAVPVAAVLGVVVRAMVANYKRSRFYGAKA
jgi:predicted PurR-regulated permease PerM